MNKSCEKKTTAHSQNMLHVDVKERNSCFFFTTFIHLRQYFVFFLFINLQVEHTLDKWYNEP
jgi:hypothetical protein